ncbi:hypothetical protein DOTSEDRAFT_68093 [Lecanosticta acicola]|uniref:Uncharacterized protein n=1 Tax=Lecanosticta acicola TaxID=111012 RepID=A0AAI8Z180_9PEZI|nr:hypothetical protein DOTSEDRAFT_68093 [Lecanosticta acicola]
MPSVDQMHSRRQLPAIRTAEAPPSDMTPSRSRTEPPVPEQQQRERSGLQRRLHSNSLRHRAFTSSRDHHRQSAKVTVQSAIELKPPISFDAFLRRDRKSPDSSRRGSGGQQLSQQQIQQNGWIAQQQAKEAERRKVKPLDVRKAKEENAFREKELRDSLKGVEEIAMSSTRQLDDTYYSILENASMLRSTVASLQQLAEESRRMHSTFQEDTAKLQEDTQKNLVAFHNFEGQEKMINDLVGQLKNSKTRTGKLNDRLEQCRNRVEAFERRENARQKSRRKNWGIVWAVVLGFVVFVVAVITAKNRSIVGTKVYHVAKVLDSLGNEVGATITGALKPSASPSEDPYLKRLFDQL